MPIIQHADQEFHVSHEEEEKLNQFQLITAFPDEDLPQVIKLLRNHTWQLEPALSRYFDGNWRENLEQPPVPARPPTPITREDTPRSATPFVVTQSGLVPRLPIVKKLPIDYKERFQYIGLNKRNEEFSTHPALFVLLLLPRIILKLGMGILAVLWSIISFGFNTEGAKEDKVSRLPAMPDEKYSEIEDDLDALLGENSELGPLISKDSFNQTFDKCEGGFKYMLFICLGNISSEEAEKVDVNSQRFVKHILNDPSTLDILKENSDNLLVYMRTAQSSEMWSIAKQFKIKYTPECLLIGNVLNSADSMGGITRMSVLARLKMGSLRKFQNSLKVAMDKFNPEMVVNRSEQEELKLARQIKQMQDQAFEESLKKDRIKEEERQRAEEEARAAEELALKKEHEIAVYKTVEDLQWLHLCTKLIVSPEETQDSNARGSLQFRTPDGKRLIRKFSGDCTLKEIYHIVKCHLFLDTMSSKQEDILKSLKLKISAMRNDDEKLSFKSGDYTDEKVMDSAQEIVLQMIDDELCKWYKNEEDYEFDVDFELVSPFPRYRVPYDDSIVVRNTPQLWPNGSMLVEYLVSDSDDE